MLVRNHTHHNFPGPMDSIATSQSAQDGFHQFDPVRTQGESAPSTPCHPAMDDKNRCCPPPKYPTCPPPADPDPKVECCAIIVKAAWKFFVRVFTVAIIIFLIVIAYVYGRERCRLAFPPILFDQQDKTISASPTPEGGPCRRWSEGVCREADDAQWAIQHARRYLKLGDAESAIKNWPEALSFYRATVDLGSSVGAQSAIYAAKRIQFQSMSCEYNENSLARIARDYDKNPLGDLIEMKQKQQALSALGYYNGNVDNRHGPDTRSAIRTFQGDLWFDQTGVLTAEQTVLLVCGGAQIAKDIGSQNVLGVMYAGGLGVRQNTDFSLDWLSSAAQRGDADAAWNLALMYGTQTVLSSVQICDAVQNAERADGYLKEAADSGHPAARRAKAKFAHLSPEKRWRQISGDLNQPEALIRVGRGCNPNG